nr:reverse transcriptase [Tanacetum cinerariifolium]
MSWLGSLGPILTDFSVPKISFQSNGSTIYLIGEPNSTSASPSTIQHLMKKAAIASMHTLIFQYEHSPQIQTPNLPQDPYIQKILTDYSQIFEPPTSLPPPRLHDHHIPLKPNTPPVNVKPYRNPHYQKQIMTDLIADMLKDDLIKPSHSPYSSLVLLVRKKDGTWRFCVSYRALNAITIRDRFPIPTIDELLDELHGAHIFSKIDLRAGYHQILFFDDILVYSPSREQHYQHLRHVFNTLAQHRYYAKRSKCTFGVTEVHYLGHVISESGVATDCEKIKAIQDWPKPSTLTGLRGFLGLTGYYRRFVRNYAHIAAPLADLLQKSKLEWNDEAQEAFDILKRAMSTLPVLALTDFSLPFDVTTDASGTGIGAVLSQRDKPIAFFIKKWRHYLFGRKFRVFTDQRSLKHLLTQVVQSPEQYKWASKLLGYDFEVHYKPGKENRVADALSRIEESQLLSFSTPVFPRLQELHEYYTNSQAGREFMSRVTQQDDDALPGHHIHDGLVYIHDGLFIPDIPSLRLKLLNEFHSTTIGRHSAIWLIVDRLTKFAHFIALPPHYTAASLATLFLNNIYRLHGLPKTILSDRDPIFLSRFWKELFGKIGTKLLHSSAYHPQTDGQTEVVNRCLESCLRCFVCDEPHNWNKYIYLAEFWYNTSYHSAIEMTPFQALYGRPPPSLPHYTLGSSHVASIDATLMEHERVIALHKDTLSKTRQRMTDQANKHRVDKDFEVEKIGKVAYRLDLPVGSRIHPVFHVSLLRPSQGDPIPSTFPLPDKFIDEIPVLQPEEILDRRTIHKHGVPNHQVLVKWKGRDLSESTWETAEEIAIPSEMSNLEDKVHIEEGDIDTVRVAHEEVQTRLTRTKRRPARFDD